MSDYDEYDRIDVDEPEFIHSTDQAHLVLIDDKKVWIPRSVIDTEEIETDEEGHFLMVASWFAEKEGLI